MAVTANVFPFIIFFYYIGFNTHFTHVLLHVSLVGNKIPWLMHSQISS